MKHPRTSGAPLRQRHLSTRREVAELQLRTEDRARIVAAYRTGVPLETLATAHAMQGDLGHI